jgi:hypothetical protein
MRTDIHRPSAIRPEDYVFIECHYIGCKDMDPFEAIANAEAISRIRAHMEHTGGKYSGHLHGGTCHICGAFALYLAVFYHPATNRYIECGEECAEKMDMGEPIAFQTLRRAIANARDAKAGKMKARVILEDSGLSRAWELYNATPEALDAIQARGTWELSTLRDIIGGLIRYGSLSEKQQAFVAKLVNTLDHRAEVMEQRQAEKDAAAPCPTGRHTVTGTVIKTDAKEGRYGTTYKMAVKTDAGYVLWGTIPGNLLLFDVERQKGEETWTVQRTLKKGDTVRFTATIEPSVSDPKFGFYARPTNAEIIELQEI